MNSIFSISPPRLQKILHPTFEEKKLNAWFLRLDEIHPTVNGNKWFKLKYNLEHVLQQGYEGILTFGGQFSNHIYAIAAAAKMAKVKCVGIIGGANPQVLTHTLRFALQQDMHLEFVAKNVYRKKDEPEFVSQLQRSFPRFFVIPEGGTNEWAIKGAAEITSFISIPFDYIITACATGGTLAGLAQSLRPFQKAVGISVLKGENTISGKVSKFIHGTKNFDVITGYDFGGYAKYTPSLIKFMKCFYQENGIPLEQVYTAKMVAGTIDMAQRNYFKTSSTLVLVHTGGMQGLDTSIAPF
jgi:1-aminocyclopropane-1-carboxylate deaminase